MKKFSFALVLGLISTLAATAADPAQLQLARDVIQATRADRNFERMTEQLTQQSAQALNLNSVTITPEQRAAALKTQEQVITLLNENAKAEVEKLVGVYAEVFTEGELKGLKTFFESPEGKAFFEKMPQVGQRFAPVQQAQMTELVPKLKKLIDEARAAQAATPAAVAPITAPTFTLPAPKP